MSISVAEKSSGKKANGTVESTNRMPSSRSEKGKASAIPMTTSKGDLPSPSPETDRRSAREYLTTRERLPSGDHEPSDAESIASLLRELASAACQGHPDPADAAKALLEMIAMRNGDAAPIRDLLIWSGALEAIYNVRDHLRDSFKRPPANPYKFPAATVKAVGAKLRSILDQWIVGSRKLGDCTGAELEMQAAKESETASGHQKAARFYRELARRAGDKPVRQALSVKQVNEIGRKIFGENFGK